MHSLEVRQLPPPIFERQLTVGVKGTGSRACPPVGSHPPLPSCVNLGKLLSVPQKNGDDDTCLLELFAVKFSE